MPASNDNSPQKPAGLDRSAINLIVAAIVVALLGGMIWLAHELTHASDMVDCAARGIRNCS